MNYERGCTSYHESDNFNSADRGERFFVAHNSRRLAHSPKDILIVRKLRIRRFRAASFDLLVVAPRNTTLDDTPRAGGTIDGFEKREKKKIVQEIKEERDFRPIFFPRQSIHFDTLPFSPFPPPFHFFSRQRDSNGDWRNPLPRWLLVNRLAPASSGLFPIISRSVHRLGDKRWNCCLQVPGRQLIARIAQTSRGLLLCQASRKKRVLSRERCPL